MFLVANSFDLDVFESPNLKILAHDFRVLKVFNSKFWVPKTLKSLTSHDPRILNFSIWMFVRMEELAGIMVQDVKIFQHPGIMFQDVKILETIDSYESIQR